MAEVEDLLPANLEAFHYQVGGHFVVMSMGRAHVCKPRGRRENTFYESIPESLKGHVPLYYGVVSVHITNDEQDKEELKYTARRLESIARTHNGSSDTTPSTSEVLSFAEETREIFRCLSSGSDGVLMETISKEQPFIPSLGKRFHNKWTELRLSNLNKELRRHHIAKHDYIVLEDITARFTCPCIIDLKIGTCHGDLASPEKTSRHLKRACASTSFSLGVRFAGMLVYDDSSKSYRFYDRYNGQRLSQEEFLDYLKLFFGRCHKYSHDVITELTKKLQTLREVVSQLDSYRFFSSSLLMVYEGFRGREIPQENRTSLENCVIADGNAIDSISDTGKLIPPLADVRMIDFENSTHSGYTSDPVTYQGPDEGTILGLTTLITIFQSLLLNE